MSKPRLAIVSTLDDLCGIAGYTRCLRKQLAPYFDVTVFDLDQYFMRATHPSVAARADSIIDTMANEIASFDYVNIQLEYGTLGRKPRHVVSRFSQLAKAAKRLSVTFHTILPQIHFDLGDLLSSLVSLNGRRVRSQIVDAWDRRHLLHPIYSMIRKLQKRKPVSVIVHTRRDMRLMKYVNGFDNVYDHPLAFIAPDDAAELRAKTRRTDFAQFRRLAEDTKIIGVFGFLGEYKGFDVAIKALHHLPENYHLAFFGGLHPNEVRVGEAIHPYVRKLLNLGNVGRTVLDRIGESKSVNLTLNLDDPALLDARPGDMRRRLHFMGPQTDDDFAKAMTVCDCVVMPYLEVGQASSGPLSIAVDMGAPIVAARNHAFIQFGRYHPNFGETFEIGNHLELAEKIEIVADTAVKRPTPAFNTVTNAEIYRTSLLDIS